MANKNKSRAYDFTDVRTGTIVKRSRHWMKEHSDPNSKQLGVLVDKEFYMDDSNTRLICWPVIRWEGSVTESIPHPCNAVPYRKAQYDAKKFFYMYG